MKAIKTAIEEVYGLFVEDSSLAILILLWVGIVALVFPKLPAGTWRPITLFAGLLVILLENVRRSARK